MDELGGARCVVFGGAGFLGSHVARELVAAGARVSCFDLRPATVEGAEAIVGDVTDAGAVRAAVTGADHIFAFAGGTSAARSLADPFRDLTTSCVAQLVLLEAVRELAPQASVVFPGSRLEYGRARTLPVAEDHPLDPTSPYAIHKIACDEYHRLYASVHGLHTVVLRIANPYGPHASGDAARTGYGVLNGFVDTAAAGGTIKLYGGGAQLRDFVYVDDVVDAALLASVTPAAWGQAINIGSGAGTSLRQAADAVIAEVGSGSVDADAPWPEDAASVETGDYYLDISRARDLLGWTPATSLTAGIRLLADAARTGRVR